MTNDTKFSSAIYTKIGYDELVVFAASLLAADGRDITFENLVATCFENFPDRFALRGYPQWPDASTVNKSWLRCRSDKGYLVGRVKEGFKLTPKGFDTAARIERTLNGKTGLARHTRRALTEAKTREGSALRSLEQSIPYRRYEAQGDLKGIGDFDVCDTLLGTLDSSPATLRASLKFFRHAASLYSRDNISRFLDELEGQFPHLFREKTAGGMMHSKI
jgi:hypothetical protein